MRIRRTLPVVLAVVIVVAAIFAAVELRKSAPPEAARLLPSADAFFYADFGWLRKVSSTALPAVSRDPDFEQFIHETGFEFERDLNSVAFAVHYPANWPGGGTGASATEPRFSEVLIGKFDLERVAAYLKHAARSVEAYNSVDIFTIPIDNRALRVAVLSVDAVAASNHDDPGVIRGIVDRSRRLASPFGGPALLRRYYRHVQLASPIWAIAHIEPAAPEFSGWSMVLPHAADLVVSASYNPLHLPLRTAALHLRAEAWAGGNQVAHDITEKMGVFLANFRTAEMSVESPVSDADLKTVFDSLEVRQEDSRAIISATLPTSVFRRLVETSAQEPSPAAAPPAKAR